MPGLRPEQELKFNILAQGISIDPSAEQAWHDQFTGPLSLNEYASTSGICLRVGEGPDEVWLNAPYLQDFTSQAEARLRYDSRFLIEHAGDSFDTQVIPVPAYHDRTYTRDGKQHPYTNLGVTHTDRIRISP